MSGQLHHLWGTEADPWNGLLPQLPFLLQNLRGVNSPNTNPSTNNSSSSSSSSSSGGSSGGLPPAAIIGIVVAAVVVVVLLLLLAAVLLCLRHNWQEMSTGVSPRDGTTKWAVKRAKLIDVDFQREVQQMADKNHPNIVRLLGFAVGGNMRTRPEQVLIYEFVPNGDLARWLHPTKAPFSVTLPQRLGILIGTARGLEYLHRFGFVHRDIKPANILIGADMQAKVADFGLVRVGEGTTVGCTRVMGTPGYVDPVYSRTSKATTDTDAYIFGVLILVVLTGRALTAKAATGSMHILPWVDECLSKGDVAGLKSNTSMDAPDDVLLRLTHLALTYTVDRTASRPTMGGVANELQAVRNEVGGKEEVRAAVKVDEEDEERNVKV
ncbi:unnamed protein product [Closterium sp. NIES-54]